MKMKMKTPSPQKDPPSTHPDMELDPGRAGPACVRENEIQAAGQKHQLDIEALSTLAAKLDSAVTTVLASSGPRAPEVKLQMLPQEHQIHQLLTAVNQILPNLNASGEITRVLAQTEQDSVLQFSVEIFKHLYGLSLGEPLRLEALVALLEKINTSCPKLGKDMGTWVMHAPTNTEAQRCLHRTVLLLLVRSRLLAVAELDHFLADRASNGLNNVWVGFVLLFIQTAFMERISLPNDFPKVIDLITRIADGSSLAGPEVIQAYKTFILYMLEEIRGLGSATSSQNPAPLGQVANGAVASTANDRCRDTSSTSTSATATATGKSFRAEIIAFAFSKTTKDTSSTSTSATATATGNTTSTSTAFEQRQPNPAVKCMYSDFDNTATGNTTSTSTASTVEQRQPDPAVSCMQIDLDNTATGNTSSTITSATACGTATGNTTSTSTASTVEQRQPDPAVSCMQIDLDNTATGNTSSTSTSATAYGTATGNTTSTSTASTVEQRQIDLDNTATGNTSSTSTSATAYGTATGNTTSTSTTSTVEQRQPDPAVSCMQTDFDKLLIGQEQRTRNNLIVSRAQRLEADFEKGQSCRASERGGKRPRIANAGFACSKEAEHQATHQDTSLPASSVPPVDAGFADSKEAEHQATHQDTSLPASSVPPVVEFSQDEHQDTSLPASSVLPVVDFITNSIDGLSPRERKIHIVLIVKLVTYSVWMFSPHLVDLICPSSPKFVGRDDANNEVFTPSTPCDTLFPNLPASTDDNTDSGSMLSFDESELPPSGLDEDTVRAHEPKLKPPPPPPPPPPKGGKAASKRIVSPRTRHVKHTGIKDRASALVEARTKTSKPAARKDKAESPKALEKISSTTSNPSRRRTRSQSQHTRRGRSATPRSKKEKRTTVEQDIKDIEEQAKAESLHAWEQL
ncbi:hypothetical protein FRACYDRAFT_235424 [Fragilariopsis cylindrus CCMP1102]|uniref:CCR4-NOT transcription complex subunit 1-like NOT1 connector domain-containing protein n=1 Tax=Fragilariopsis cylindrus CCMP1102 TaxID=635003 RepID=A0A1E7FML9_9STRA|nr:hypothetical protein FRACYDRAFT_235424 [Fragilariopsis cylindrus CCMP1102]|eukprot:OEU19374.1 hypothetical protein FRACYDRAFT_235424 [Fragilariopsis cylindrus CCMP1102]